MDEKVKNAARAVLGGLIYPTVVSDLSESELAAFNEAVDLQAEYMQSCGGMGLPSGFGAVVSEAVGDVKRTYAPIRKMLFNGTPLSPSAISLLHSASILCNWV